MSSRFVERRTVKTFAIKVDPLTNEEYWEVFLRGQQLLSDPLLNKASWFTEEERIALDLVGLLWSGVSDLDLQEQRTLEAYRRKPEDDLEKYICLQGLMDRNEVLFYRLVVSNLAEMVPIVHTPTVGQACLLPPMDDTRAVSRQVAKAVAIEARDAGLGRLMDDQKIGAVVAQAQWEPRYAPYRPGRPIS